MPVRVQRRGFGAAGSAGRPECGGPVVLESPVPLCEVHLRQTFLFVADRLAQFEIEHDDRLASRPLEGEGRVVYYARRRRLVKIGTTDNLPRRMHELDVDELLTTEPGGYRLEQMRLKQFDHLRIAPGHEWLDPEEDLWSHIEMVKQHEAAAGRTAHW